jgi:hypothetical protein
MISSKKLIILFKKYLWGFLPMASQTLGPVGEGGGGWGALEVFLKKMVDNSLDVKHGLFIFREKCR